MSEAVGAALRAAVRGPEPTDIRALVKAAGGAAGFARLARGIEPGAKLPAVGSKARLAYEAWRRDAARWVKETGEVRKRPVKWQRLSPARRRRITDLAWRQQELRRWDELKNGARTRLIGAEVTDETPKPGRAPRTRLRTMPGVGQPGVFLRPATVGQLRAAIVVDDDDEAAGDEYVTAFFTEDDTYVWDFEPEVLSVEELHIWPHDVAEGSW